MTATTHYQPLTGLWPDGGPEPLRLIAVETLGGRVCPEHHNLLQGGPRWLHCTEGPRGGHRVFAATLDVDPLGRAL